MPEHTPAAPESAQGGPGVVVPIAMRWGDMDAYGHINNVEVVRMLEEARVAAFGVPVGTGHQVVPPEVPLFDTLPEGTQALVVEHRVKYVRPLEYHNVPAPTRVHVVRAAGAALILGIEIRDPATGESCVRAHTQLAFFDPQSRTVLRLQPAQREVLAPYMGDPLVS